MPWSSPLRPMPPLPAAGSPASFGAARRYDVHTGVDLHCPEGTPVYAVEEGLVVAIVPFTGPDAESPWWRSTRAVLVEGSSGVVLYGEVNPSKALSLGSSVATGEVVGHVTRVLREDKGKPTTMLHLELYVPGTREPLWWLLDESCPAPLRDPTNDLQSLVASPTRA